MNIVFRIIDFLIIPLAALASLLGKFVRTIGLHRLPLTRKIYLSTGTIPVRKHYYEPLIEFSQSFTKNLQIDRNLKGISFNIDNQLEFLKKLSYANELIQINNGEFSSKSRFNFNNSSFKAGDADILYQIIRYHKPKTIIEIGSGNSTLIARCAVEKNENEGFLTKHICIEPYEMPWLESLGIEIIREKVENINLDFFNQLSENDLLFIDSSHMIRSQGDVLFEFHEILPSLNKGVIIHVHDIFTPKDYLKEWVVDEIRLWNEQYLFESFMAFNSHFEIILALNFLKHNYYQHLLEACPALKNLTNAEPGSIYIKKIQ